MSSGTNAEVVGAQKRGITARHPLVFFFLFTYAGTWLVWATFVLSQDGAGVLQFNSPLPFMQTVAIGTFMPALAALLVTALAEGRAGVRKWWQSILQWRVKFRWYLFALVGVPVIMTLGAVVLPGVWDSFSPIDRQAWLEYLPFFIWPALVIGGPLGEEPGWRGFALPRLQQQFGPLVGSLVLGVLWAIWHWPIWFSGQWTVRSVPNLALYFFWITAMTVIMTWVFNHTRQSTLLAILVHTSMDAFPNAILWPMFPAATKITSANFLYGYLGLAIAFGIPAVLIVAMTRGRLGYQPQE